MKITASVTLGIIMVIFGFAAGHAATYTYTAIDYPGATTTTPYGVNSTGVVVGSYYLSSGNSTHGFIWKEGKFTQVEYPGSGYAVLYGVNDDETVVGIYTDENGVAHGFSQTSDETITKIDYPDSFATYATGINNDSVITGFYGSAPFHGYTLSNGSYSSFDYPTVTTGGWTCPYGINDSGDIVGYYRIYSSGAYESFSLIDGTYATLNFPEATATKQAGGINNLGTIVGDYADSEGGGHGFLYSNETYTSFDYPDATLTSLNGINTAGLLVGTYYGTDGKTHGFLATPLVTVCKLTVSKKAVNNGAGQVATEDGNINCGKTCTHNFPSGTRITLDEIPASGSTFTGWSGGGCTGTAPCSFIISKATTVSATFTGPVQLTVHKADVAGGSGSVSSQDGDINCGTTCKASYPVGSQVKLTAAPASGSTFTGWSGGACTGTGTCTYTLNKATTVSATFTGPVQLTVQKTDVAGGSGSISSQDGDINCGTTCKASYPVGISGEAHGHPRFGLHFHRLVRRSMHGRGDVHVHPGQGDNDKSDLQERKLIQGLHAADGERVRDSRRRAVNVPVWALGRNIGQ